MNKFVRRKNPFNFPVDFPASPVFFCQKVHSRIFPFCKSLTTGSPIVDFISKAFFYQNSLSTLLFEVKHASLLEFVTINSQLKLMSTI